MKWIFSIIAIFSLIVLSGELFAAFAEDIFFSPETGRVNLKMTLGFEKYISSGGEEYIAEVKERMLSCRIPEKFEEEIKKADNPIILMMVGMTYCPDCKVVYPYMEAASRVNPNIRTAYVPRNGTPGAREFINARNGRTNMPAIFALKADGKVLDGSYIETPSLVSNLLAEASSSDERERIWNNFHSGVYDDEIMKDLLELIKLR